VYVYLWTGRGQALSVQSVKPFSQNLKYLPGGEARLTVFPHCGKNGLIFPHNGKNFRGFSTQWKKCFHTVEKS
jgi:hypothetical protein